MPIPYSKNATERYRDPGLLIIFTNIPFLKKYIWKPASLYNFFLSDCFMDLIVGMVKFNMQLKGIFIET